jgi:dTDP-D-glucose 4,6-dehydratase
VTGVAAALAPGSLRLLVTGGAGFIGSTFVQAQRARYPADVVVNLDALTIRQELGWQPRHTFESALAATVAWYRDNRAWWSRVLSAEYRAYYDQQYGDRLRG